LSAAQGWQTPPSQKLPVPQCASDVHLQAAPRHTGVRPEQATHPAGETASPQCAASSAAHARHAPRGSQYRPMPHAASVPHTQAPSEQRNPSLQLNAFPQEKRSSGHASPSRSPSESV